MRGLLFLRGGVTGPVDNPEGKVVVRMEKASLGSIPLSEAGVEATLQGDRFARVKGRLVPAGQNGSVSFKSRVRLQKNHARSMSVTTQRCVTL